MQADDTLDADVVKAFRVIKGVSQEKHLVKSTPNFSTTYNHPGDVSRCLFKRISYSKWP